MFFMLAYTIFVFLDFVEYGFISSLLAERLVGKNTEMTYFVSSGQVGHKILISQSIIDLCAVVWLGECGGPRH